MKPLLLRPETAWLKDACQSPQERPCRRTLSLESQFASGEIGDKFQIGFEEVIREQFGRLGPLHVGRCDSPVLQRTCEPQKSEARRSCRGGIRGGCGPPHPRW